MLLTPKLCTPDLTVCTIWKEGLCRCNYEEKERMHVECHAKMEAEVRLMQQQAKGKAKRCWEPPEMRKKQGGILF